MEMLDGELGRASRTVVSRILQLAECQCCLLLLLELKHYG
jgi:hypothetical protein